MASPCGSVSPEGGGYGLTLFRTVRRDGLGSAYLPEGRHLRMGELEGPHACPHTILVKPVSIFGLSYHDDIYQQFTCVSHTARA